MQLIKLGALQQIGGANALAVAGRAAQVVLCSRSTMPFTGDCRHLIVGG